MDPIVKPSFIPKPPLTQINQSRPKAASSGLFSITVTLIVLGTLASYGFVYLKLKQLETKKTEYIEKINDARKEINSGFVSDMYRLQNRINGTKALVANHVVVSPILKALEETTLQKIQYKSFGYKIEADTATTQKTVRVMMDGIAPDYKTIALQSDAFATSTLIKNPIFLSLKNDNTLKTIPMIGFQLEFTVNAEDLSYQKLFSNQTAPSSVSAGNNQRVQ